MRPLPTWSDHRAFDRDLREISSTTQGRAAPASGAPSPAGRGVTRRFYWELVSLRRSGGPQAAAVLADRRMDVALSALRAARPEEPLRIACVLELADEMDVAPLLRARAALARHEIALDLWPQLAGAERFLNTGTAEIFQQRLLPLLDVLARSDDGCDIGVALDLEPNEALARAAWEMRAPGSSLFERARALGRIARSVGGSVAMARQGRRDLAELARDLQARDLPVHVAVMPPLSSSTSDTLRAWALGCPAVDDDGRPLFGLQAAMCYASLTRRLPERLRARVDPRPLDDDDDDARDADRRRDKDTLALWAARHRTAFDAVVVGMTATGILGDEPVYEDPAVLAEDVRAMEALGFSDVALYALEGLFFGPAGPGDDLALRPDVERWLGAAFGEA